MTKWIFLKSDEAGMNTGAEPNGGTDAAASTGRPRTGVGAAGVNIAVAVGSEEAGTGIGTEAGSGTDAAVSTSGPRTGVGAADAVTAVSIGSRGSRYWHRSRDRRRNEFCRKHRRGKTGH